MKRLIWVLVVGAGLLSACSDSQTLQTAAGLAGTYDLTIVGQYVFVTSSDRNELRALDLNASPRDFVRAPNPLEPLSIPVLERPLYLERDVRHDAEGQELYGPYVYARSAGSQAISVVGAGSEYLQELTRLRELGFVTAFAARGSEGGQSVLYYATQSATDATLYRQVLPGPEALAGGAELPAREVSLALPGETVIALLVLPAVEPGQELIVVATRGTRGSPARTFRLDGANPQAPLVTYAFGAPVRLLATHPRVANTLFGPNLEDATAAEQTCGIDTTQPQRTSLQAGEYVFGVLDESACGGQPACTGVLAVDSATGTLALDSTGYPMLPLSTGVGLPTGIALVPSARVNIRCTGDRVELQQRPMVGIIPTSDGQIHIFDAVKLRPFDFNTSGPGASFAVLDASGTAKNTRPVDTYVSVALRNGATRGDTYRFVYEGPLPAPRDRVLSERTLSCAGGTCAFKVGTPQDAQFVGPGDVVVLEGEGDACELTVVSKGVGTDGRVELLTGPLPEGCAERSRFSLRASAGAEAPFVVYSDSRGFEGRVAEGGTIEITGGYFFHPVGFEDEQPVFRARLTLTAVEEPKVRGDQYLVSTQSGFSPFVFTLETSSLAIGLTNYRLPGPVAHTRVSETDLAYIAYPSADGILQVNLGVVVDNVANVRGLLPFE